MFIFFQKSRKMVNSITHRIYICCYQYGNYIRTVFDNQCLNPIILFSDKYRLVHKTKCQVTLRVFKNIGSTYLITGFFCQNLMILCYYSNQLKSDNLQYNTLVRWANGTNDSLTKRLTFQVFFFHNFLQT